MNLSSNCVALQGTRRFGASRAQRRVAPGPAFRADAKWDSRQSDGASGQKAGPGIRTRGGWATSPGPLRIGGACLVTGMILLALTAGTAWGQSACCILPPGAQVDPEGSPAMIIVWDLDGKESLESLQKRVRRLPGVTGVQVCTRNSILVVEFDRRRQTASRITQFVRARGVQAAVRPQCCALPE